MRRALPAAVGTLAGLIGLLGYKSGSLPSHQAAGAPGAGGGAQAPAMTPSPSPSPSSSPATAPKSSGATDGTFTGPVVNNRYGPVQVRVTISGGELVDVTAVQLPVDRARSAAISNAAAPVLRREALAAHGANIDTVSGATYTSEGYARSLQAALDAARR